MAGPCCVFCYPPENPPYSSTCSVAPCQAVDWKWLCSFNKVLALIWQPSSRLTAIALGFFVWVWAFFFFLPCFHTHVILVPQPGIEFSLCSRSIRPKDPPGKFPSILGVLITLSFSPLAPPARRGISLPFYESWPQGVPQPWPAPCQPCPHLCKHWLWYLNYSTCVPAETVASEWGRFLPFLHTQSVSVTEFYFCEIAAPPCLSVSARRLSWAWTPPCPASSSSVPFSIFMMLWWDPVRPILPTCHFCFWVCLSTTLWGKTCVWLFVLVPALVIIIF